MTIKNVFFLLFIWTVSMPSMAANIELYIVKTSKSTQGVNLRTQMSTKSGVIFKLPNGEVVEVLQKTTQKRDGYVWYKVRARKKIGFVASEFLEPKPDEPNGSRFDKLYNKDVSEVYWLDGNKLSSELSEKVTLEWTNDFKADKIATLFRLYEKKTKALRQDLVYPEMIEYVNDVTYYYSFIADMVSGSDKRYGKNGAEKVFIALLDILKDRSLKNRASLPLPDIIYLTEAERRELGEKYAKMVESEKVVIQSMRTKYGLIIKPW